MSNFCQFPPLHLLLWRNLTESIVFKAQSLSLTSSFVAGKGPETAGIKAYWEIGLLALSIWPLHQYVCTTPAMDAYRVLFVGLDITYDTLMCWDPAKSGLLSGTRKFSIFYPDILTSSIGPYYSGVYSTGRAHFVALH